MALPGLQGYQGDSEISDSEGELSPLEKDAPMIPSAVLSDIGLGIPKSHPVSQSPPPFTKPTVHSAPSITLVNYDRDDDDELVDLSMEHEHSPGTVESKVILRVPKPPSSLTQDMSPSNQGVTWSSPNATPSSSSSSDDESSLFLPLDDVELPPSPDGVCSQTLQDKLVGLLETKKRLGITPFDQIKIGKSFRNPSIYEKLIQVCGINEFGTNYSKDVYDPDEWTEEDYYEKLSEAQKKAHEVKMRARAERSKIEFKTGTKLPPQTSSGGVSTTAGSTTAASSTNVQPQVDSSKQRKTKWDVASKKAGGGAGSRSTGSSPVKEAGLPVGYQALINARVISKTDIQKLKSMKK